MPTIQAVVYNLRDALGGYSVKEALKAVESSAGLPEAERHSIRERRLSALLLECFEYVEAYRPYRSLRNKARNYPFEVLSELPVLTQAAYRKDPNVYFNPNIKSGRLVKSQTKMTVGYNYYLMSKDAWSADYAARVWTYSSLGLAYTSKHISISGRFDDRPAVVDMPLTLKRKVIDNETSLFGSYLDVKKLAAYAALLGNEKLGYCIGPPSVIAALATLFEQNGISLSPSYGGLIAVSESLLPEEREVIQRVFKKPVYSVYATRDDGLIACECEHGGMHVLDCNFHVEEADGGIVVTNLHNSAAPRMRYKTGETGVLTNAPCPCGREGKRFERLEVRKSPLYTAPDGRLIPGAVLDTAAEKYYNIVRYKLSQPDPQNAELTVELRTGAAHDEADALHRHVCALMPGTRVELKSNVAR